MRKWIIVAAFVLLLAAAALQARTFTESKLGNYSVKIGRFLDPWTGQEEFEITVEFDTLDSAGNRIRHRGYGVDLASLSTESKNCLQTLRSELKSIIKTREAIP